MFTYYQAENSTAEPALVNAIEQGLRAQHGVVTEDDILMELTKWVEASDNDILRYLPANDQLCGQWPAPYALRCYA